MTRAGCRSANGTWPSATVILNKNERFHAYRPPTCQWTVLQRGQGQGFSGIDNALFVLDQTRMLYGDAQAAVGQLIQAVKAAG